MNNPNANFQNFISVFKQAMTNPAQYVMKNYGISEDIANDPDAIIQNLMKSGKLSQQQYNQARQMAAQIQQNPMFGKMMK